MNAAILRLMLAALLLLGGCSMETAMNSLVSAEDRRFAEEVVTDIRRGNEARLRPRFMPHIWIESENLLRQARSAFQAEEGRTKLVGYHHNTNMNPGRGTERRTQFVLVTEGSNRWAVTQLETYQLGDQPRMIVGWRVTPRNERPPELAMFEASERFVPWLWAFGVGFVLVVLGIIFAFIRYRRRKRA